MRDITSLSNNAELAFSAYANLQKGRADDAENTVALLAASGNNPSLKQITGFTLPAFLRSLPNTPTR